MGASVAQPGAAGMPIARPARSGVGRAAWAAASLAMQVRISGRSGQARHAVVSTWRNICSAAAVNQASRATDCPANHPFQMPVGTIGRSSSRA